MNCSGRETSLAALCFAVVSSACGGGDDIVKLDASDVDAMCLNAPFAGVETLVDFDFSHEDGSAVKENQRLMVSLFWNTENDTIRDITKSCEVERVGNELRVSARMRFELEHPDEGEHYASHQASCATDALEAGRYVIVLGDRRVPLTVPSGPAECTEFE